MVIFLEKPEDTTRQNRHVKTWLTKSNSTFSGDRRALKWKLVKHPFRKYYTRKYKEVYEYAKKDKSI